MWTVVYMAKNEEAINLLKAKLKEGNVMSRVKKVDDYFELLVPASEMGEAHSIIIDAEIEGRT